MKTVSVSPHVHSGNSIQKSMIYVTLALLPSAIWGVYAFGLSALIVLAVSIISALLSEYLLGRVSKEFTLLDGSALVTGLLIGMNMPPTVPLYVPIIGSFFAIFVVKWTFGGLGCNWMNPALAGRVFVFFSFTTQMSTFTLPRVFTPVADTVSSATMLSANKTALLSGSVGRVSEVLQSVNIPVTEFASKISQATGISPYTVDAFFGNQSGCIGEVSALLLILGGLFLIFKGVMTYHITLTYLLSFSLLSWAFGGIPAGLGLFNGEVLNPLFTGGLMLGAFFMATDWVTTPTTIKGQVIFALGCGFFTFLFRYFGSLPEGVSLAIIIMNIVSPTIDRYVIPKKFGYVKPIKEKK